MLTGRKWIASKRILWLAGVFACICFLWFNDPVSTPYYPRCPFRLLTGLYCPGCGSLRAAHSLLHGDLMVAIRMNILLVVFLPLIVADLINTYAYPNHVRNQPSFVQRPYVAWLSLAFIVMFWILRNVALDPLTQLAPQ
jgi:hypothetical protein